MTCRTLLMPMKTNHCLDMAEKLNQGHTPQSLRRASASPSICSTLMGMSEWTRRSFLWYVWRGFRGHNLGLKHSSGEEHYSRG